MPILTFLTSIFSLAGGLSIARLVGRGVSEISQRIMPYESSRAARQIEHNRQVQESIDGMRHKHQMEVEKKKEKFQAEMQEKNFRHQEKMQEQMIEWQTLEKEKDRHHALQMARQRAYDTLRHSLIQESVRNFPLNISPLVLLENNNIDITFLLGSQKGESTVSSVNGVAPTPLSVFVTPMHLDSRVAGKEVLAAQIYDNFFTNLESLFVSEYGRNGERPVIFYSAAWNKNVRPGLHAADELNYFLKDMPTIVVEPRFNGTTINIFFSCWGIGYRALVHNRQEFEIPLDLNAMVTLCCYERSKKALQTLSGIKELPKVLQDKKETYQHNVKLFETLDLGNRIKKRFEEIFNSGSSSELDELGDYSKMFYIHPTDTEGLASCVNAVVGMLVAALADIHHLLMNDVRPRLPEICNKYFGQFINQQLLDNFSDMYETTYLRLSMDYPEEEGLRLLQKEGIRKLLNQKTDLPNEEEELRYSLIKKCSEISKKRKKELQGMSLEELKDYYIDHYDNDTDYLDAIYDFLSSDQQHTLSVKQLKSH